MEEMLNVNGETLKITLEKPLSVDEKKDLIRQLSGNLGCKTCGEKKIAGIIKAAPAYTLTQGNTRSIVIVASGGTAPYKYSITMDATVIATLVSFTGTTVSVPHLFNESVGSHVLKVTITDSCPSGALVSNIDTSAITINAPCTNPVCGFTLI